MKLKAWLKVSHMVASTCMSHCRLSVMIFSGVDSCKTLFLAGPISPWIFCLDIQECACLTFKITSNEKLGLNRKQSTFSCIALPLGIAVAYSVMFDTSPW